MTAINYEMNVYVGSCLVIGLLIIFISIKIWRRKLIEFGFRQNKLVENSVNNCGWVNELLSKILTQSSSFETTYNSLLLAAINNSVSNKHASTVMPLCYSHIELPSCIPELSNMTVSESTAEAFKFKAQVQLKRILLAGYIKSESTSNEVHFSAIVSDLNGDMSLAWLRSETRIHLDASFLSTPHMTVGVKFASSSYTTYNPNDVGSAIQQNISNIVLSVPLLKTKQPESVPESKKRESAAANRSSLYAARSFDISHFHYCGVRILKASSLYATECDIFISCMCLLETADPYCVIDVDRPARKFSTSSVMASKNPFWDEKFFFEINETSNEVRLEVFDRAKPLDDNFIGRAVLSFDDVVSSAKSEHIISLVGPRGVQLSHNPTITIEMELLESMPSLSDFALRVGRGQSVIPELLGANENNSERDDLNVTPIDNSIIMAGDGPKPSETTVSDAGKSPSQPVHRSFQNSSADKVKAKGIKSTLKKHFSFNKQKSSIVIKRSNTLTNADVRQSADDLNMNHKEEKVIKDKHLFGGSLRNLFRRKHKSKVLKNGSLMEATVLENDEAANGEKIEQQKLQSAAQTTADEEFRAVTLPRVKKNK